MFPNLLAEMARNRLTGKDVSVGIGMNYKTWKNKMQGRTEFTCSEMVKIKTTYFSTLTLDYLFSEKEIVPKEQQTA